jgi:predicted metal-dependent hydrolase
LPPAEPNTASGPDPDAGREASTAWLEASYERGLELIGRGELFEAHEQLELAWRGAEDAERDFFQGLVHVAVAWYQAGRGRPVACQRQLEKALRRLGPYAPRHRRLELAALIASLERALETVRAGSLELEPPLLPRAAGRTPDGG